MPPVHPLPPDRLYHRCDPASLDFETTADLEAPPFALGQDRAFDAIRFGIGMPHRGYNLFVMGPPGAGKHTSVRKFLAQEAEGKPIGNDWCYAHNFDDSDRPRVIELPPGKARELREGLSHLVDDLSSALPAAFETDEYRARQREFEEEFQQQQEKAFGDIKQRVQEEGLALVRTPGGLALAPARDGQVLPPEEFNKLPDEERKSIRKTLTRYEAELEQIVRSIPKWRREMLRKVRELNRAVTAAVVSSLMEEVKAKWADVDSAKQHLEAVEADILENSELFRPSKPPEQAGKAGTAPSQDETSEAAGRRYDLNILIDHADDGGAPVVYEDNPNLANLLGRIEHLSYMGTLVTDFMLIKPGALHRANGGYLVVDALKLLMRPLAWEGLKRALRSRQIRIESVSEALGMSTTVTLEPAPVPFDTKIVLVGDRMLYYMLHHHDPDFSELFKIVADFEESIHRDTEACRAYAGLVAGIANEEGIHPLDREAVARVIEHGSRTAGDGEKVSVQTGGLADLLRESDYFARQDDREVVTAGDVQRAIDGRLHRTGRLRERIREHIVRGTILIDTAGKAAGQVNALSVLQLGGSSFGSVSRITARVRLGNARVLDIERESKLGGPIHSKGVMILSGFLAGRYVPDTPLALQATLVFEQSYAGIEGDSASSTELYALLSALAEAPIRQGLAVTGSVNQHGQVQAIGGVNEKIEGMFDICDERGLTGDQGVVIPESNVKHLMLRSDVVQAVADGKFHIWAVSTIDEGIEILTGVPAGERGDDGHFPEGSINERVESRLRSFAERAKSFRARPDRSKKNDKNSIDAPGEAPTPEPSDDDAPGDPPLPEPSDDDAPGDPPLPEPDESGGTKEEASVR